MFATILVFFNLSDPMEHWIKSKIYLSEDYLRIIMINFSDKNSDQYVEEIENPRYD